MLALFVEMLKGFKIQVFIKGLDIERETWLIVWCSICQT